MAITLNAAHANRAHPPATAANRAGFDGAQIANLKVNKPRISPIGAF